jgi:hypothetical protein
MLIRMQIFGQEKYYRRRKQKWEKLIGFGRSVFILSQDYSSKKVGSCNY